MYILFETTSEPEEIYYWDTVLKTTDVTHISESQPQTILNWNGPTRVIKSSVLSEWSMQE